MLKFGGAEMQEIFACQRLGFQQLQTDERIKLLSLRPLPEPCSS
jgi:hypothetical protein